MIIPTPQLTPDPTISETRKVLNAEIVIYAKAIAKDEGVADASMRVALAIAAVIKAVRLESQSALVQAEQARDEALKKCRIIELATPLEEELSSQIEEMCKHLAMEDGFSPNGVARLLVNCQHRLAADWSEIGDLRRQRADAQRDLLARVREIAKEAWGYWDTDQDSKVGKILKALAGHSPGYRADIDALAPPSDPPAQGGTT